MARRVPGPHPRFAWLDQQVVSRSLVGGKGFNLSRLATLGAPVPTAGALTTPAYADVARSLGLPPAIRDLTSDDLLRVRLDILTAPLPLPVANTLADVYQAFTRRFGDDVALAVRSSATAEDAATSSFAGLHDTILDVRTPAALEIAVRRCWASLWSDRAVAYRVSHGLDGEPAEIAVVTQHLVRSDVSFIAFTADPVSGRHDHLVISASWGLGEAIVSGLVSPDHIVIDAGGEVHNYVIGDKHLMIVPGSTSGEGTREVAVPRALRTMPALSHRHARAIATMARALVPRLGYEADLEGGIMNDAIFLFQARPITTLSTPAGPTPLTTA
jgi:rifampicin phosphotransferase